MAKNFGSAVELITNYSYTMAVYNTAQVVYSFQGIFNAYQMPLVANPPCPLLFILTAARETHQYRSGHIKRRPKENKYVLISLALYRLK